MTCTADIEKARGSRCRIDLRDNPFSEFGSADAETNPQGTLRESPDTKQSETARETGNLASVLEGSNPIPVPVTSPSGRPTLSRILTVVSAFYELPRSDLISCSRRRRIVRPRQVAMALARELTTNSTSRIGQRFGGKDHSTVIHAIRKIATLVQGNQQIASDLAELRARLSTLIADDDLAVDAQPRLDLEHMNREIHPA